MKIRVTKKGEHAVMLMHSGWPEGTILAVSKNDGDAIVREGFGELVIDEPAPEEAKPEKEVEEKAEEEAEETEPEAATAEPAGETTMRPTARRRRRGD